ncbi:6-phosphogluconolactonase [Gudongella sp. DL1XJH-153]|uniref:6-phosphogluconolactonase n=1 Tax=Gudongella sp. DL1XJH-153 TaxID=3409804 RepID=UPI003BB4EADC
MKESNVRIDQLDKIAHDLGLYVKSIYDDSILKRGEFRIGLSGGSSMDIFAEAILNQELLESFDWNRWHVFFVDERLVPPTSKDSNHNKSSNVFLKYVNIPDNKVHTYDTHLEPYDSAIEYENEIRKTFGTKSSEVPNFDLIILGLGQDGHTASLFPNHPILEERKRLVTYLVDAPKFPPIRMSFTLPLINNARNIAFITAGSIKMSILQDVLDIDSIEALPTKMVAPKDGSVQWFVVE